jgi:ElaB/YqjD/DUF883 family membrane-anchored ribosome-binding protein
MTGGAWWHCAKPCYDIDPSKKSRPAGFARREAAIRFRPPDTNREAPAMTESKRNEPSTYEYRRPGAAAEAVGELREAGQHLRQAGSLAAEAATERMDQLKEQAGRRLEQGLDKVKSWEQGFEGQVSAHPFRTVMIAAGVGLVLGLLWRRS